MEDQIFNSCSVTELDSGYKSHGQKTKLSYFKATNYICFIKNSIQSISETTIRLDYCALDFLGDNTTRLPQ